MPKDYISCHKGFGKGLPYRSIKILCCNYWTRTRQIKKTRWARGLPLLLQQQMQLYDQCSCCHYLTPDKMLILFHYAGTFPWKEYYHCSQNCINKVILWNSRTAGNTEFCSQEKVFCIASGTVLLWLSYLIKYFGLSGYKVRFKSQKASFNSLFWPPAWRCCKKFPCTDLYHNTALS